MAIKSSPRGIRPVTLIAGHTAEGARTARSLAAYFNRDDINASSHVAIDPDETLDLVPRTRAAWTLRSGNPISVNAELCAFAQMTRDQWLSTTTITFWHNALKKNVSVDNPRAQLDRFAAWVRRESDALKIPLVKLTAADVAAGKSGVIGHIDWTVGMRDGTHTDPGAGFPWDYVMDLARNGDDDMPLTDPDVERVADRVMQRLIGFRPTENRNLWDNGIQALANQAALAAALGGIAADKDVTPETLSALIDKAVAAHTPTAAQNAEAARPFLEGVVRDALGEDNADQAQAIIDKLIEKLKA